MLVLDVNGILEKYNVELIGVIKEVIEKVEDCKLFDEVMCKIGFECLKVVIVENMEEVLEI